MDKPWLIRTYAGHSSAKKSNELYLKNLSKGQTGISVAFDLPTQTGYDSDHILAKGEVGKVGVSKEPALVILLEEGASSEEVINFSSLIINDISEKYGVTLELEPIIF